MDNMIKENDFVLIYTEKKKFVMKIERGKSIHLHTGEIKPDEIIGREYGCQYKENYFYKPTLDDIILYGIKRKTQIVYTKESATIAIKLNLQNGMKVFESGTGSGALSIVISRYIAPDGMLYTYEREKSFYENAKKNIENFGNINNVKMFCQPLEEGIKEKDFDAAFLDCKEFYQYIEPVKNILKPGGTLGIIIPTTNQIINALHILNKLFHDIEIIEISIRHYKNVPERLRPVDIMVGHTGYLIFAR